MMEHRRGRSASMETAAVNNVEVVGRCADRVQVQSTPISAKLAPAVNIHPESFSSQHIAELALL